MKSLSPFFNSGGTIEPERDTWPISAPHLATFDCARLGFLFRLAQIYDRLQLSRDYNSLEALREKKGQRYHQSQKSF